MATYGGDARPGDIVVGADGAEWGVLSIGRVPRFAVTLVKGPQRVTGYPAPETPVTIRATADVPFGPDIERRAAQALSALGPVELIGEWWEV